MVRSWRSLGWISVRDSRVGLVGALPLLRLPKGCVSNGQARHSQDKGGN